VAILVKEISTRKKYVAKKIMLGQLNLKEKNMALAEAELLKCLDNPFIVKYKESFMEAEDLLIIVMEYCERGDLSNLVKIK
jgi:NIMA (never in mitosis gene a)-related kinase